MENTRKFSANMTPEDSSSWFIAIGRSWLGPLTSDEVFEKINSNEITIAHFIWKEGQGNWERICTHADFAAFMVEAPPEAVLVDLKQSLKENRSDTTRTDSQEPRLWFMHFQDSQIGPFTPSEIRRYIRIGKVGRKTLLWKDGLKDWEPVSKIPEFLEMLGAPPDLKPGIPPGPPRSRPSVETSDLPTKTTDLRKGIRKPVVARIFVSGEERMAVGVCRDLSIGGMQVLTDKIPGKLGSSIRINVSPSEEGPLEPFVAEGVIVRILEDGLGFSFRFNTLSAEAKASIEAYLKSK